MKERSIRSRPDLRERALNMLPLKRDLLDHAFTVAHIRSVAELGCVWGVEGGYSRYLLTRHGLERLVLVDTHWTPGALAACRAHPEISVIEGDFGSPDMPARIGPVDAVILFDVLLHQAAPDWDAVLAMYAQTANIMLIVNPQWTGSDSTVRLLDMDPDEYARNVPASEGMPIPSEVFETPDAPHPTLGKRWRDVHCVWQWGITERDMTEALQAQGYEQTHRLDGGPFGSLANFRHIAYMFERTGVAGPQ